MEEERIFKRDIPKIIVRILMFFIVVGYGFLAIVALGNYGSQIEALQDKSLSMQLLLVFLGIGGAFSVFCLWGLMLYHWGKNSFRSPGYKRFWLITMTIGMFLGSWIYYFIVFECGKTLLRND